MHRRPPILLGTLLLFAMPAMPTETLAPALALGERPAELVASMRESPLKTRLERCIGQPPRRSAFSIGHRGAPLRYPEHTRESYEAAARMGAGYIECDVTFTRDRALVCRHAQCDLHLTTDILATPLAARCARAFRPARFDGEGRLLEEADAYCCTSDLTLAEFRQLRGRHPGSDPRATTAEAYQAARTPTEQAPSYGLLLTHRESIDLIRELGARYVPELKGADEELGFGESGYTLESYAAALVAEYRSAGVDPADVRLQSFDLAVLRHWLAAAPAFGRRAILLDGRYVQPGFDPGVPATWRPGMTELADLGIRTLAPPLWVLLAPEEGRIVPSAYARAATAAGLELMTWTLERSGSLTSGGGWYYQSVAALVSREGDVYDVLEVLAREVGVRGVFSDWPATVTLYANCQEAPGAG